jgi:hypothetical protein
MQHDIHLPVPVHVFEFGRDGNLVGVVRIERRAFIDTGVGVIAAGKFDNNDLPMQVLENKVGRMVGRVAMADDFISLVHARVLVRRVQLLVRPPDTEQLEQEP